MTVLQNFLLFPLLFPIWAPRLWDDAAYIPGRSSVFVNPFWKLPHRHTQKCVLLISFGVSQSNQVDKED
jgi:hypothetical protein